MIPAPQSAQNFVPGSNGAPHSGRLPVWLFWPRVIVALAFAVVVGLVVRVAREPLVVAFAVAYYYGSCNQCPVISRVHRPS